VQVLQKLVVAVAVSDDLVCIVLEDGQQAD
jgi:hypothetical protein